MPGILWHKFEDQRVGAYLAQRAPWVILDIHGIACFTVDTLSRSCPDDLKTRYKLKELNEDCVRWSKISVASEVLKAGRDRRHGEGG